MPTESENTIKQCPFPLKCFGNKFFRLQTNDATAFQFFRIANGAVVTSNLLISTAFITLAKRSLGCKDDQEEECVGKVYGFRPSSLITLMSTVSGLLSAFLLPIIGAIVDNTKYRRQSFACIASAIIILQATHIGISNSNWFPMAILQPIKKFFFDSISVAAVAYQIEIRREVGERTMINYLSRYYAFMFGTQFFFILVVGGATMTVVNDDDISTARFGQCLAVVLSGSFYFLAVYFFTNREPNKELTEGQSLILTGIKQVGRTSRNICKYYPTTLTWFLLSVVFGQAAISSFTAISVTFFTELDFAANRIIFVFLIVLFSTLLGGRFASWFTKKTNPLTSMKVLLIIFILVNFAGFFMLSNPVFKATAWGWSVCWGFLLGWYYPCEALVFSSLMPKGQESELSGFFLYCGEILSWLPTLIFTIFNESKSIHFAFGGVQLNIFLTICLGFYFLLPSWEECMEITGSENKMIQSRVDEDVDQDPSPSVKGDDTPTPFPVQMAKDG